MQLIKEIVALFEANRNYENAAPMAKYMKNQFPFLGIKTPARQALMQSFYKKSKILATPFQEELVLALWEKEEREYQYAALHYLKKSLPKLTKKDLPLMQKLITTKSWWDTVDMLAQHPVGTIALNYPEVIPETIIDWAQSENMWLRRTAILFQLKYKENTDEELLSEIVKQNAGSKEFFIQKAIGWALREYSKTNPESVKKFIAENKLPKLSQREGSKYL
ncbi:MAG: DNA alkylation repair protein [Firmicutes bacterium]|nr:DNA alkylation repair protein [Bacillota bacterium]